MAIVHDRPVRTPNGERPPWTAELFGVSVHYGGVRALENVSFRVAPNEILGLIGPNGAGKTTLFDTISGVQALTKGRIEYDGHDITRSGPTRRARLGMRRTFQRSQPFGWLSVEDNILAALDGQGGSLLADLAGRRGRHEMQRRERVREVLSQFDLEKIKDEAAGRLPIGTIRMVELARAIVSRPRLLLLDEPTSGLDARETAMLGDIIERTRTDERCAVVLVEHDVPFVMSLCDRVIALHLGMVLAEGSPAQIQQEPAVRAAYLG